MKIEKDEKRIRWSSRGELSKSTERKKRGDRNSEIKRGIEKDGVEVKSLKYMQGR